MFILPVIAALYSQVHLAFNHRAVIDVLNGPLIPHSDDNSDVGSDVDSDVDSFYSPSTPSLGITSPSSSEPGDAPDVVAVDDSDDSDDDSDERLGRRLRRLRRLA